jgi:hypothetical protein
MDFNFKHLLCLALVTLLYLVAAAIFLMFPSVAISFYGNCPWLYYGLLSVPVVVGSLVALLIMHMGWRNVAEQITSIVVIGGASYVRFTSAGVLPPQALVLALLPTFVLAPMVLLVLKAMFRRPEVPPFRDQIDVVPPHDAL